MKVSKKAYMKFQVERVGNVYMLQNSKVTDGGLQLSSASEAAVVEQSETNGFELGCPVVPEERLGLDAQQGSPDRYSYGGAKSHKSCVGQRDRWVKKFRLSLNLFDLIKL